MGKLLCVFMLLLSLSACSVKNPQVPIGELLPSYHKNDKALGLLYQYVSENNAFTEGESNRARSSHAAVTGMIDRLEARLLDGSVDYFYMKYFLEDIGREYATLRELIDPQLAICDNPYVEALYAKTRDDIEYLLRVGNAVMQQADKDIQAANMAEAQQYVTKLIGALGPLMAGSELGVL
jgi:hypothetical protein